MDDFMNFGEYVTSQIAQINAILNKNTYPLNKVSTRICEQLQQSSHPLALHNQHQPSGLWDILNSVINVKYLNFKGYQQQFSISHVNEISKYQFPQHQFNIPLSNKRTRIATNTLINATKSSKTTQCRTLTVINQHPHILPNRTAYVKKFPGATIQQMQTYV